MIKVAIVDDDDESIDNLKYCINEYSKEYGDSFSISVFKTGVSFLDKYKCDTQIIFMDIDMPGMNGLEVAKRLRAIDTKAILVFVTILSQYAIKGYEVDAMDYLLKPLKYPQFKLKIKKAITQCAKDNNLEIVINSKKGEVRLLSSNISYVEISNHDILYHTDKGDIESYGTMKQVESLLPKGNFYRCNTSYLVNLDYVNGIVNNQVKVGDVYLDISRPRKKGFKKALHNYYIGV